MCEYRVINVQILQIPLLLRLLKGFISNGGLAFGYFLFIFLFSIYSFLSFLSEKYLIL